ncbi:A disintegrin and metalloproteinase with thrombospondin motifs 20-like isoform X1 [Scleropages formosus]|uniref:A disintegrin and metalloproteinase with thrombospondin motifs 20-like isoform X1 n=1 Tax=Scleropages formosus TaxID=113540 RepID=UPI0010FA9EDA|nr:A disintegrin and metalloproteinase with thrombospondin motifs 20-like isoform X1 [Scleropages formosus]
MMMMQFSVFLVGLVYHLSLLVADSLQYDLHPKQESFIRQLSSYEIVSPLRLNDFGEPFPPSLHFSRRRRRSARAALPVLRAHYRIDAFGQRFYLNLSADSGFIGASYTVTHVGAGRRDSSDSRVRDISDMRHCFFRGRVNNSGASAAVMSLCGGLNGMFTTQSGDYFLEPLMTGDGSEQEDEHNKPHLVYRHERQRGSSKGQQPGPFAVTEMYLKDQITHHCNGSMKEEISSIQGEIGSRVSRLSSSNPGLLRRKRFLSYPRFVELMVTADSKMVKHHGHNVEHYILTIMSVVAAIYRDPSVGNLINVVLVKLVIIHDEQAGPSVSSNAATTLHNFCLWQQAQNVQDDSHPSHHDTALLITREDICRTKDKCDTLGLAELGTMCDPQRSCSISEENGLSTSFTIAHELGHVFNVPHDDSPKCKEAGVKQQYHVMAPMLNYNTSPWSWSKCSRNYITEFLDTGYGDCLLDEPAGRPHSLPRQLPGQRYSATQQCEFIFGPGSRVCPYMKQCKRLWCTSVEGEHRGCRTQHMPLADGTDCGLTMHCRQGACVHKDAEAQPVRGEWGSWGPYTACSRSCGGGTRSAARRCDRPEPRNGGEFCVGRRMKFRSCNTDPCPRGQRGFREEQCAQFDGRHFNINGLPPAVRWVPKYSGILPRDRCRLFCRVAGTTAYYQLRDRVADGTPCGSDTDDICVRGLCRQAGCDRVLNSKAKKDRCGICGGDDSSCRTLVGTFNSARYGYNVVVRIPAGATNIDVRQRSYSGKPEDDNYLALSDGRSAFLLNGDFVVSMFRRDISVKGTVIEYSGSDVAEERINCTDRIEEELVVQVLCVGNLRSPEVRYSFSVPLEEHEEIFVWEPSGPWQECSHMCQGQRRREVVCVRERDRLPASAQRCEHLSPLDVSAEPCNAHCQLRWRVVGRSECSAKCGPGYRTRDVRCVRYSLAERKSELTGSEACAHLPGPPARDLCHGDCLRGSWYYGAWSQCSKTCGRGTRTRNSYCKDHLGRQLPEGGCSRVERLAAESCGEEPCPDWFAAAWSECSPTCGVGVRHRQVRCILDRKRLTDQMCDPTSKPSTVWPCHLPECASWQAGHWGACSVTCGWGHQMRTVRCVSAVHVQTVDDSECNAASRPRDAQTCEVVTCPQTPPPLGTVQPSDSQLLRFRWRYGSWTTPNPGVLQCSVSCGWGQQARYVSCRDAQGQEAEESSCAHLTRPPRSLACFRPCGRWQAGEWSPCSATCGVGSSSRSVVCVTFRNQPQDHFCPPDKRPGAERECSTVPCPSSESQPPGARGHREPGAQSGRSEGNVPSRWRTGQWGACSGTCGLGIQRRVVVCQDTDGRAVDYCGETGKPAETRSCDSGPCPHWNYGLWGECTRTCGGGQRSRRVVCQRLSGQSVSEHMCDARERPADAEPCNRQPCPGAPAAASWQRRPWGAV